MQTYIFFPFLSLAEDDAVLIDVEEVSLPLAALVVGMSEISDMVLVIGLTLKAGTFPQTGFVEDVKDSAAVENSCCCAKRLLSFCEIFLGIVDYIICDTYISIYIYIYKYIYIN